MTWPHIFLCIWAHNYTSLLSLEAIIPSLCYLSSRPIIAIVVVQKLMCPIQFGFLLPSYWHILSKATLKDGADKVTSRYLPSAYITAASDAFTLGVNPNNSLNKASYFHRDGGFTTRYEINL